jgi:CBS domain-containing protein
MYTRGQKMNLETVTVRDVMISEVLTVSPETTTLEALKMMITKGFDQLPVRKRNRLLGMVSWREIGKYVILKKKDPRKVLVNQIMRKNPQILTADQKAIVAFENVIEARTALPVISKNKLVGLFTFHDFLDNYLKIASGKCSPDGLMKIAGDVHRTYRRKR